MIIALGIVSVILLIVSIKFLHLKADRDYLDKAACDEHSMAKIAIDLLYEGSAKKQELSFEDTCHLLNSIRRETNVIARRALAEKIIGITHNAESKHFGFE